MTTYQQQAEDFLKSTDTTIEIKEAEKQTPPAWEEGLNANHHIKYIITLKNKRHTYTFDYWGSIADYQKVEKRFNEVYQWIYHRNSTIDMIKNKSVSMRRILDEVMPTPYDILSCLDTCYGDTFEDFCFNYGYDEDSRKAYETYQRVQEQERNLYKLFNHEELERLNEIN